MSNQPASETLPLGQAPPQDSQQIPAPGSGQIPGMFYASNYLQEQGVTFEHSVPATLTTFATLFGISSIELYSKDTHIYGAGSVAFAKSGIFQGELRYNNPVDVSNASGRYQLICQALVEKKELYMYFVQPPEMVPRVLFKTSFITMENVEFSGLIHFN